MKKTYKNPLFEVVEIQTEQFIAMSTLGTTDETMGNLGHEVTFSDWGGDEYVIDDDAMNIGF